MDLNGKEVFFKLVCNNIATVHKILPLIGTELPFPITSSGVSGFIADYLLATSADKVKISYDGKILQIESLKQDI